MEARNSLVCPDRLVADSHVLDLKSGPVCGHQMVQHGADQGELQTLAGEEVGEDDSEDGAEVPTSEHGLQQLFYRRGSCARLALH